MFEFITDNLSTGKLTGFLTAQVILGLGYAATLWGIGGENPITKYYGKASPTDVEMWMNRWFAMMLTVNTLTIAFITFMLKMTDGQLRRLSIPIGMGSCVILSLLAAEGNTAVNPHGLLVPKEHKMAVVLQVIMLTWMSAQLRSGSGALAKAVSTPFSATSVAHGCVLFQTAIMMFWWFDIQVFSGITKYATFAASKSVFTKYAASQGNWFAAVILCNLFQSMFMIIYAKVDQLKQWCKFQAVVNVAFQVFITFVQADMQPEAALTEGKYLRAVILVSCAIGAFVDEFPALLKDE